MECSATFETRPLVKIFWTLSPWPAGLTLGKQQRAAESLQEYQPVTLLES